MYTCNPYGSPSGVIVVVALFSPLSLVFQLWIMVLMVWWTKLFMQVLGHGLGG